MKRTLFIIPLIFLILLSSCAYKGYSGNYSDLYTVAINSVLWLNGHSWGADFECDPQIVKIDEDNYGRTLFSYYEKHYSGADDISFSALLVCQTSSKDEVFYYEDVNYVVKKQELYSQKLEEFSAEEIEALKSINDWNKELDYNKCISKKITKKKAEIPFEKEIKKQIIDDFDLTDGEYSLFMDYLTSNSDNSEFIVYGYILKRGKDGVCFVGLVKTDNDLFCELNTFVPLNVYDYKSQLTEFKKANNWQ